MHRTAQEQLQLIVTTKLHLSRSIRLKNKIEITRHEKVRFIKVNELKLTQVELFSFFRFMCVAAKAFEVFYMTHLANTERFLYYSKLSF